MSILSSILHSVFGATVAPATPSGPSASTASAAPQRSAGTTAAPGAAKPAVDVIAVLSSLAAKSTETLNWRTSIVDLMKLVGLDSSLSSRKKLATELHYTGDANDSATMNIWLHKQVMTKMAENGGTVPDQFRAK